VLGVSVTQAFTVFLYFLMKTTRPQFVVWRSSVSASSCVKQIDKLKADPCTG
jgi:hypothetical protein